SGTTELFRFQGKENEMTTHRWMRAALFAGLLLARHATADDEIVVYGKRSDAVLVVDRGAVRVDVERERRALSTSLERALAGDPKPRAERVASAPSRPPG